MRCKVIFVFAVVWSIVFSLVTIWRNSSAHSSPNKTAGIRQVGKIVPEIWNNRTTSSYHVERKITSSDNGKVNQLPSKEAKDTSNMANIPFNFSLEFLQKLYIPNPNFPHFLRLTEKGIDVLNSVEKNHDELWNREPHLSRRTNLEKRCNVISKSPTVAYSRMVYDDHHRVIMCEVPKAACSTWKKYMYYLMGKETNKSRINEIKSADLILNDGKLPLLSSLSETEALNRLLTYTTFFVTRHPLERFVSAHRSKFSKVWDDKYYVEYGKRVAISQAEKYLKGVNFKKNKNGYIELVNDTIYHRLNKSEQKDVLKHVDNMNKGKLTFQQFAEHVVDSDVPFDYIDVHWRPQVWLCNPCAVTYDFIIRFEHLAEDSNRLLKYLQRNDPKEKKVFFDSKRSPVIERNKTKNALSSLPKPLLKKLISVYSDDFRIFNYSPELT